MAREGSIRGHGGNTRNQRTTHPMRRNRRQSALRIAQNRLERWSAENDLRNNGFTPDEIEIKRNRAADEVTNLTRKLA